MCCVWGGPETGCLPRTVQPQVAPRSFSGSKQVAKLVSKAPWAADVMGGWGGPGSRIVSCKGSVAAGVGVRGFSYTRPVAESMRLLSVRVWVFSMVPGSPAGGAFLVFGGHGVPQSVQEVEAWSQVLPIHYPGGVDTWIFAGDFREFCWDMDRLYLGEPWRFAIAAENFSATQEWWFIGSFQVMEV